MLTLGRHLIVELYDCATPMLDDVQAIRELMLAAAERVGATVCGEVFHRFAPNGVSGAVVIAESHLSIHTWPTRRYVAVDIFTCGGLDPKPGFDYLAIELAAGSARTQEIVRGLPDDLSRGEAVVGPDDVDIITHRPLLVDLRESSKASPRGGEGAHGPS